MSSPSPSNGCASPHTLCRIAYLTDPTTVDALLDEFQSQGMPMGSDRWAEYCLTRLRELRAKEYTLQKMLEAKKAMDEAEQRCGSNLHREQRRRLTLEFQERKAREEEESMKKHNASDQATAKGKL